jgi:transposase
MLGLSANLRYYQCCGPTDMRNGFDGLAGIVRNNLGKDPVSGDIFIFLNKPLTHIKLLYWDGDGFALFYKRLEKGRYQRCTVVNSPSKEIKREELMMLLEGLSFDKMRQKKRFKIV